MPDGSVVVVEMFGPRLTRVHPDGSTDTIAEIPADRTVQQSAPTERSTSATTVACSLRSTSAGWCSPDRSIPTATSVGRIQRVDVHDGTVTDLYTECDGHPLRGPNDIVMDGHGGFWFTDHGIRDTASRRADLSGIYYGHVDGSGISEVVYPTDSPNGIGLSPDTDTLYWAETHNGRVHRRTITQAGRGARAGSARPLRCALRLPRLPVARLARRRRRGLDLRRDARQRRHHGDLTRRQPRSSSTRPVTRSPPTSASAATTSARPTSRVRAAARSCRSAGPAPGCASPTSDVDAVRARPR